MATKVVSSPINAALRVISEQAPIVDRQSEFPEKSIASLAEQGKLGLIVPRQLGGHDANAREFVDTVVSVSSACGSTGMIFVMHCCGIDVIKQLMQGQAKDEILKAAAAGKHLSTLACSERATGINSTASLSKSKLSDKTYHLNAEKVFVTSGGYADSYVVSTQAHDTEDPMVTSLYLVSKGSRGQEFSGVWQGLGLRGNCSCAMTLKDCLVPDTHLLGEAGQGLAHAMSVIMPRFLLGTAAVYTGIAQAAFDACVAHVKSRSYAHNNEALSALPTIRRSIAEMKVALDTCITFLQHAAEVFDNPEKKDELMVVLFEAKQIACKTSRDVSQAAMQLCGGIAYSGALSVERHMRDAMAGSVMAPSSEALLDLIGKAALGLPLM